MRKSETGLIGLGTMGATLSLNIAEKGFAISVFNRTIARVDSFTFFGHNVESPTD